MRQHKSTHLAARNNVHQPISGGVAASKTSIIVDDIKNKTYQLRKQKEHNLELCLQVIAVVVVWLLCHHYYCCYYYNYRKHPRGRRNQNS